MHLFWAGLIDLRRRERGRRKGGGSGMATSLGAVGGILLDAHHVKKVDSAACCLDGDGGSLVEV